MWLRGKEYYSVNKWVGILNRDYAEMGIKVDAHDVHVLFNHFGIKGKHDPNNAKIIVYPKILVNQLRTMSMSDKFLGALYNISEFGDINAVRTILNKTINDVKKISFWTNLNETDVNNAIKNFVFSSANNITSLIFFSY